MTKSVKLEHSVALGYSEDVDGNHQRKWRNRLFIEITSLERNVDKLMLKDETRWSTCDFFGAATVAAPWNGCFLWTVS